MAVCSEMYKRGATVEEEQQSGCLSPIIIGASAGMGCVVSLVAVLLVSLFILIMYVA